MTALLLRLFVRNDAPLTSPKGRAKVGSLSGTVGLLCNIILFGIKFLIGTVSGSLSIIADAMNNLSDASSSVVTLIGFRLAEKPADEDHPYGHARYEYLSGLAVAALILLIGYELGKSSIEKILHPTAVSVTFPLVLALLFSIGMKLWMYLFNRKLGKLIDSTTLQATASDSRNDVISTAVVLLAALIETFTDWRVDGFMGLGVALFILYSGIVLAKETISPLLGETASPELRRMILETIRKCPKVLGYHDLMVHDYGPGQRFASVHVEMNQKENPLVCHELIDDIERECLKNHNIHLVIHYDPIVTDDPEMEQMRVFIQESLKDYDIRLSIHDFRMVRGAEHTNLIFDIALPYELVKKEKYIKEHLDGELEKVDGGKYYTVIEFDPEAFNRE